MLKTQAVIFTRVSTTKQDKSGLGREDQERACREFCERQGLTVASVIHSTKSGRYDEQMNNELGQAIALANEIDGYVLVAKLDRLSRSVETVARFINNGVPFISVELGREVEPVFLHLLSAVAEYERTLASERTKKALAAKKARGERVGATDEVLERAREAAQEVRRRQARERNDARGWKIANAAMMLEAAHQRVTYSKLARMLNEDPRLDGARNIDNSKDSKMPRRWYPNTVAQCIRHALENYYGAAWLFKVKCWPQTLDGVNTFNPDEWRRKSTKRGATLTDLVGPKDWVPVDETRDPIHQLGMTAEEVDYWMGHNVLPDLPV